MNSGDMRKIVNLMEGKVEELNEGVEIAGNPQASSASYDSVEELTVAINDQLNRVGLHLATTDFGDDNYWYDIKEGQSPEIEVVNLTMEFGGETYDISSPTVQVDFPVVPEREDFGDDASFAAAREKHDQVYFGAMNEWYSSDYKDMEGMLENIQTELRKRGRTLNVEWLGSDVAILIS